jgi:GT2 family glycosyltransferase
VSVIVPTHNRPAELAECVVALAALDYPEDRFEVIVVDDGSDPPIRPRETPARPGLRIRWLCQVNAGPSAARNAGARAAIGEILAFTDDDCAPAAGWLAALAAAVERQPETLHGGRVENGLRANPFSVASQVITDVVVPSLLERGSALRFFTSNNLGMAAVHFRALGGFDESFRTAEDREFCHRWVMSGRPMATAPSAVIEHRHRLTLKSFWRQHVGYGRGAFRYHRKRARDLGASMRVDPAMCLRTFRRPFEVLPAAQAIRVALLLVVEARERGAALYNGTSTGVAGVYLFTRPAVVVSSPARR